MYLLRLIRAGQPNRVDQSPCHIDYLGRFIPSKCGQIDQVRPNTKREGTSREILGGVCKVDPTGGNEMGAWERSLQGLNVLGATGTSTGENLDDFRACFERRHDFRGGQGSRDGEYLTFGSSLKDWNR